MLDHSHSQNILAISNKASREANGRALSWTYWGPRQSPDPLICLTGNETLDAALELAVLPDTVQSFPAEQNTFD